MLSCNVTLPRVHGAPVMCNENKGNGYLAIRMVQCRVHVVKLAKVVVCGLYVSLLLAFHAYHFTSSPIINADCSVI